MKRPRPNTTNTLSRKDFLRGFASLVAYSAPAVVALNQLGCSGGGGTPGDGSTGEDCSYSGSSMSCSSVSATSATVGSCSISGASISC